MENAFKKLLSIEDPYIHGEILGYGIDSIAFNKSHNKVKVITFSKKKFIFIKNICLKYNLEIKKIRETNLLIEYEMNKLKKPWFSSKERADIKKEQLRHFGEIYYSKKKPKISKKISHRIYKSIVTAINELPNNNGYFLDLAENQFLEDCNKNLVCIDPVVFKTE